MKEIFVFFLFLFFSLSLSANDKIEKEIPRYVSIKSTKANLRVGPDMNYPIILQYNFLNLPLRIDSEYDMWRKVTDIENNIGWIHTTLLSNKRFGIIKDNNNLFSIFNNPNGKIIGKIGGGYLVELKICEGKWCKIKINKYKGWLKKNYIWGVSENENFN